MNGHFTSPLLEFDFEDAPDNFREQLQPIYSVIWYLSRRNEQLEISRRNYFEHRQERLQENKLYRLSHKEQFRVYRRKWAVAHRSDLRLKILKHYSSELRCARCGFPDIRALTLDHIIGGGTQQREMLGGADQLCRWIVKNGFPDIFQVLCQNCNFIKSRESGMWGRKYG